MVNLTLIAMLTSGKMTNFTLINATLGDMMLMSNMQKLDRMETFKLNEIKTMLNVINNKRVQFKIMSFIYPI